jgi:alpha-1,2-mannosyltransferase
MIVATVVALAIRLFTLARPGFLTQPTEYDDGVYLGAAIRMTQGVMPYRDFAYVQPPGILLLMTPVALFARITSTVAGMALARVLTTLASAACVPLVGNLVRYRGTLVTALACGILAIYPSDVATAHTLLLEPWMNLLCLLGANAAFSRGRLAVKPGRLAWAGIAIGFAGAVKFWSAAPALVLLVICLLAHDPLRWRRTRAYLCGLIGAFVIPLAPFVLSAPGAFIRSTIVYQAARVGTYTSLSLRLAHITGLIDFLNYYGQLSLTSGANSLFGDAVAADTAPARPITLPYVVAFLLAVLVAAGYLTGRRTKAQLEWFALATAVLALAAIIGYSAFFYHYPAFPGPWLALVAAVAIGQLLSLRMDVLFRWVIVAAIGIGMAGMAVLQLGQVSQVTLPPGLSEFSKLIPPGACVVSDDVALTIAANRFEPAKPGCPVVIDSLATTLVITHGVSIQGGADYDSKAVRAWEGLLAKAQYVWLSTNYTRRIPQSGSETTWFSQHFTQVWPPTDWYPYWVRGFGQLFERNS